MIASRAALAAALGSLALASPALAANGSAGIGDKYFPKMGNGGYDVRNYELDLDYDPVTDELAGLAKVKAIAKQGLDSFHLDYRGPAVTEVAVAGEPAAFEQKGRELVVEPAQRVPRRTKFRTEVVYAGVPGTVTDPDGSTEGWTTTADGSAALGEPLGSPAWFPCNNHPTDKAKYTFNVTVPSTVTAVANGRLESQTDLGGGKQEFVWEARDPMASYLATLAIGIFSVTEETVEGIESYTAVDPLAGPTTGLDNSGEAIAFLSENFGDYPFEATGAIVDLNPTLGYALETQTRPYYSLAPGETTVVHELAHQWYGNSVTLGRWKDIWLNEGFATFAEWMWDQHNGGPTTAQTFDDLYATDGGDDEFWNPKPGDPKPAGLFDETVYTRGAMTLEVIRQRIGDPDFAKLLRRWHSKHAGGHATTPKLKRLAERVSGEQLDRVFRDWLYTAGKPGGYGKAGSVERSPAGERPAEGDLVRVLEVGADG
jgi:aminopeptidase N